MIAFSSFLFSLFSSSVPFSFFPGGNAVEERRIGVNSGVLLSPSLLLSSLNSSYFFSIGISSRRRKRRGKERKRTLSFFPLPLFLFLPFAAGLLQLSSTW